MNTHFLILLYSLNIGILFTNCTQENENINKALVNIKTLYETNDAEITKGVSINNKGETESYITINIEKSNLINDSTYDIINALSGSAMVLYDYLDEHEKSTYDYIEVDIKRNISTEEFFTIKFPISEMRLITESLSIVDSFYTLYSNKKYNEALLLFNDKINIAILNNELHKMDSLYGEISDYNIKGFLIKEIEIDYKKEFILNIRTVCKRNKKNSLINFDIQYQQPLKKICALSL